MILIQEHRPHSGNLNSEIPGDSEYASLHSGDVSGGLRERRWLQQPQAVSGSGTNWNLGVNSKLTLNLEGAAATTAPAHSSSRRAPFGTALKTCTHQAVSMSIVASLRCMRILAVSDGLSTLSVRRCVCGLAVCDNTSKGL